MSKFYLFAAVVLFWATLSASLLRVQLAVSPVYKIRVSPYRSLPMRSGSIAQLQNHATATTYN